MLGHKIDNDEIFETKENNEKYNIQYKIINEKAEIINIQYKHTIQSNKREGRSDLQFRRGNLLDRSICETITDFFVPRRGKKTD